MRVRFLDSTNKDIDELVRVVWNSRDVHDNEYLLMPDRTEEQKSGLLKDDSEGSPDVHTMMPDQEVSPYEVSSEQIAGSDIVPAQRLLITVDSGVVELGEFAGGGQAFAVRGAAVCLIDDETAVLTYNTGPLLIDRKNEVPVFAYMGNRFGREDLYLDRDQNDELVPRRSAFETGNQLRDRCRNFVERMIQEEVLNLMVHNQKGLLLIDGALPGGTFDTPGSYLREMLQHAAQNRVDIAALSKKTRITVLGRPISALFDHDPKFVGHVKLKDTLTEERESVNEEQGNLREASQITLANELFAVRFGLGPPALTFRVDVHNSVRSTPEDVLDEIFTQCQIQGCYPRPLIDAHQFSSFMYQEVQSLTADIVARTGAIPKEDSSMEWMFAPFGSFGK